MRNIFSYYASTVYSYISVILMFILAITFSVDKYEEVVVIDVKPSQEFDNVDYILTEYLDGEMLVPGAIYMGIRGGGKKVGDTVFYNSYFDSYSNTRFSLELSGMILILLILISMFIVELTYARNIISTFHVFDYQKTTLCQTDPYFTVKFIFGCKLGIKTLRCIVTIMNSSLSEINFHDSYMRDHLRYWLNRK